MIGPYDRNNSPGEGRPPILPGLGRVALWILRRVVARTYRAEFIGDLLEEYEIILRELGPEGARRWFWGQMLRSISACLLWRLERASQFLRIEDFLARVILIALCVYLLPGAVALALLYAVAIVAGLLVDAMSPANPQDPSDPPGPARVALWILKRIVPKAYREEFIKDLVEEYETILRELGPTEARSWFREQMLQSIPLCLLWRLERAIRFLQSEELIGRAVQIVLCVYLLPALLAVVLLSMVGIAICFFVDVLGRPPPTAGGRGLAWIWSFLHQVVNIIQKVVDIISDFIEEAIRIGSGGPNSDQKGRASGRFRRS